MVLHQLRIAEGASFDSHAQEHNRYCLPNTRVELLRQIAGWSKDLNAEPIFWLKGMAGTGKSTISRTVARSFAEKDQLGASFFFKRGETERGGLSRFFMTIAADLVVRKPSTAPHIEAALIADRSITSKNYTEQFRKFLLEPLSNSDRVDEPVVIVVDALDECEQEKDVHLFLSLISRLETKLPGCIKIFLTSRPEEPFRSQFAKIKPTNSRVILHEIPNPIVEHDIDVFLRHELSAIRADFNSRVPLERNLALDWPSQFSLDRLLKMAVPLFIVAATICRFINDKRIGTPGKLLERVLSQSGDGMPQLETTYLSVLDNLTTEVSASQRETIIQEFRHIIGSVILLANPLSTSSLAELLSLSRDDIDNRLDLLHSVLSIPSSTQAPVRLLHLSFRDFLLHPQEPTMPFRVDWKQTHANLATHCLRVLECLKKDLCDITFPGTLQSDIGSETIDHCLPPEVQYSCQYWVYHLEEAGISVSDGTDAHLFLQKHFLHWIEALALIGRASESLGLLGRLRSRCKEKSSLNISMFLEDAIRFMQTYMSTISSTPLQLYSSLLIFTPRQSKIRTIFENSGDVAGWICVKPQMEEHWNNCLQTLEGHRDSVWSVVFSPDSKLVASGSDDKTVRIWRADTGECAQTLEGHSKSFTSAVFSPDSTLIASYSYDKTVQIWRVDTGERMQTLAGHSARVRSVVFSPDSTLIASCSTDETVRIWRVNTGNCMQTLVGHRHLVWSVVFSPDSMLVMSGAADKTVRSWRADIGECIQTLAAHSNSATSVVFSPNLMLVALSFNDKTIQIWRANTGEYMQTLGGNSNEIQPIVFSPDSTLIASCLTDTTIRIWRTKTGECMQTLAGHSRPVIAAVFSPDSTLIASGSADHTVRIWRADTGECIQTLAGHSDRVWSVVFSPDSTLIASASYDRTVRIWCADTGKYAQTLAGHSDLVMSVIFSPDLTLIASASHDRTVRIWRADTGECAQTLAGHSDPVWSVIFSPDSTLIASASHDHTVRIWRADTGECLQTLQGHSAVVWSIVFSPNSTLITSASNDCTVRIWRVDTGECAQTLQGHSDSVRSVVFSPDSALIASASHDRTVRIWRADTGECVHTLEGHNNVVWSVVFSPDSALIVSASDDRMVRIWRADTGECMQTLAGHSGPVISAAFSPDSTLIASASDDRTVRIWCADTGKCMQTLNMKHISKRLKFSRTGSYVITDVGAIAINKGTLETTQLSVERSGIGIEENSITWYGRKLLWLPVEFRPHCSSVSESTVVIGSLLGKVVVIGLSPDCSTAC